MAYPGVLKDIKIAVSLGVPKRVPVFAISELFDVKAGGLTHNQYTFHPEKMADCRIKAVQRFDYDWSCGWPDDYLEFEPLGVKLAGTENTPLAPCVQPLPVQATLNGLHLPDFAKDNRLPAFLSVLVAIKKEFRDTICLTGRVAAPFTAVTLLYGVENGLTLLREDPDLFARTSEFLFLVSKEWAKAQIKAGADAIWVGDCVASSAFISAGDYLKFALPGARILNEGIKKQGGFAFYHSGENSLDRLELMADANPDVLSVGGRIELAEVKKVLGEKVCLMGNIRGIEVLQRGSPEEVRQETMRIMEAGKKGGGYIFNSEEGIPYETPEENIRIMMETARKYSSYSKIPT